MSSTPEDVREPAPVVVDDGEIGVLELLIALAKHKKLILSVTFVAAVVSASISAVLPSIFTGTAKLMPPQQNQSAAAIMLGQLTSLAALSGGLQGIKNPNDLYVGMLKSRTIADMIIARFDLQKVYDKATMVETRHELAGNSSITTGRDGLITIEVDDKDPKQAAALANAYVEQLDKLTQSLAVTEAAQRRLFFERQLMQAKEDLSNAEIELKLTQERTGLIKLDDQGRAIIEAVAALRGQISAKEVELRAMRTFTTAVNPDYVRIQQQLAGLRNELRKLEQAHISGSGDILLSTGKVPEAGLEYVRRIRNVKYHETIFELLAKQFEAAKIDEAKEAAIIQVVDKAVPPDRKTKPRRSLIVLLGTLIGFLIALVLTYLRELRDRAQRDPVRGAQWARLKYHASLGRP